MPVVGALSMSRLIPSPMGADSRRPTWPFGTDCPLVDEGADVVDVGGESTRPGATRVSIETEMNRVLPVVAGLVEAGVTVSVDTMRADVAREAVNCGASIVNDVSGGRSDPKMHAVVADLAVPYVLMHWRGHSVDMNDKAVYRDTVREVRREIEEQIVIATAQGVDPTLIIVDPGIGFAKEAEHNWSYSGRWMHSRVAEHRSWWELLARGSSDHCWRVRTVPRERWMNGIPLRRP